jgi:hypothetical protein
MRAEPARRSASSFESEVLAALDTLTTEVRALRRLLERRREPRDEADAALFAGLFALNEDGTFHCDDVIERGRLVASFQQLLLDADIVTTADLGYFLRGHRDHVIDGHRLVSLERDADGAIWQFVTI